MESIISKSGKKIKYCAEFTEDELSANAEIALLHSKNLKAQEERQKLSDILARMTAMVVMMEGIYDP